ncbi:MAG: hypothetical protein SF182_25205 [Deltaproteobacteria bacterium]|nr:hypothetical protein [Deltaproteobacteria bacterium]
MGTNGFRLFLRLDDVVQHREHLEWGEGRVVEEMTSTVPGGTCLVRIKFQDGRLRTFNNDLDAPMCCRIFGIRKLIDAESVFGEVKPVRAGRSPRAALPAPRRPRVPRA